MQIAAQRNLLEIPQDRLIATSIGADSTRRVEVERYIQNIFAQHYGAQVSTFAPNLVLLEQAGRMVAAAGWRCADASSLFLERYLDYPIEHILGKLAERPVARERIVEVGNLAASMPGGSLRVITTLATQLGRLGYEWVVFTATQELIGIFSRLGLPLLALNTADPARLGEEAGHWGSYYDKQPIVVAGQIRLAMEKLGKTA
jgi:hypothetical protein